MKLSAAYYSETFLGEVYDLNFGKIEAGIRPENSVYLYAGYHIGGKTYYSFSNPYQGDIQTLDYAVTVQSSEKVLNEFSGAWNRFYRRSDGVEIYDYKLVRLKSTYRFNRYIEFRGIIEDNLYYKQITTDLLASFTYIPGTVIYFGYGSMADNTQEQFDLVKDFDQSFFFKASYNWRM